MNLKQEHSDDYQRVVPVKRFETRDGTLHETRKDAILYEIDECIAKDPDYYHINSSGYLDISCKEDMLSVIIKIQ